LGDNEINEDETNRTYGKYEEEENAYRVLLGKLKKEVTLKLGRP
jgi:hypothetical protein